MGSGSGREWRDPRRRSSGSTGACAPPGRKPSFEIEPYTMFVAIEVIGGGQTWRVRRRFLLGRIERRAAAVHRAIAVLAEPELVMRNAQARR